MEQERTRELYVRYAFVIFRQCLKILGDREEAKDAMQEVFVKFMENQETLRESGSHVAWIFKTAQNHCFNVLRSGRKFADPVILDTLRSGDDFGRSLEEKELVRTAFSDVPEKIRAAAYFTYVENLDQEEIRKVTGQSPATIRRNLSRFRDHLHKMKKRMGL